MGVDKRNHLFAPGLSPGLLELSTCRRAPVHWASQISAMVSPGEKMLYSETDPESNITE